MDQRVLVERAGAGDHDAFAVLVRGIIARLDAAARLILRDPELARDAVQDALVHAWRDLPGLRDPDRFDAWIHRITVRSCLEILRRRRSRVIEVQLTSTAEVPVGDPGTVARRSRPGRAGAPAASIPAIARSSSPTTSSSSRCHRWRPRSGSRSERRSPDCIDPLRRCGSSSKRPPSPEPLEAPRGQTA